MKIQLVRAALLVMAIFAPTTVVVAADGVPAGLPEGAVRIGTAPDGLPMFMAPDTDDEVIVSSKTGRISDTELAIDNCEVDLKTWLERVERNGKLADYKAGKQPDPSGGNDDAARNADHDQRMNDILVQALNNTPLSDGFYLLGGSLVPALNKEIKRLQAILKACQDNLLFAISLS